MRKNNPRFIILHHTGGTDLDPLADTSHHTVDIVNNWHKQRGFYRSSTGYYVGYHFFINKQGKKAQTRKIWEEGCHCKGLNTSSIGIGLAGNFDRVVGTSNHYPTQAQTATLEKLLIELKKRYNIPLKNIVPHRYFAFHKSCYGANLPDDWARNLIQDPEDLKRKISLLQKIIAILQQLIRLRFKIKGHLTSLIK